MCSANASAAVCGERARGGRQGDAVDRAHRLDLARGRGQERLARAAQVVARDDRSSRASGSIAISRRRVIESRMWSLSGGVTSVSPSKDTKNERRRALEHAAVRRDEQRLVGARSAASRCASMFAA